MTERSYTQKIRESIQEGALCDKCSFRHLYQISRQTNKPKVNVFFTSQCSNCGAPCENFFVVFDEEFLEFKQDYESNTEQPHIDCVRCYGSNSNVVGEEIFFERR